MYAQFLSLLLACGVAAAQHDGPLPEAAVPPQVEGGRKLDVAPDHFHSAHEVIFGIRRGEDDFVRTSESEKWGSVFWELEEPLTIRTEFDGLSVLGDFIAGLQLREHEGEGLQSVVVLASGEEIRGDVKGRPPLEDSLGWKAKALARDLRYFVARWHEYHTEVPQGSKLVCTLGGTRIQLALRGTPELQTDEGAEPLRSWRWLRPLPAKDGEENRVRVHFADGRVVEGTLKRDEVRGRKLLYPDHRDIDVPLARLDVLFGSADYDPECELLPPPDRLAYLGRTANLGASVTAVDRGLELTTVVKRGVLGEAGVTKDSVLLSAAGKKLESEEQLQELLDALADAKRRFLDLEIHDAAIDARILLRVLP